jgi:HSP20 family molecular chaperone IbpA
MKEEFVMRVDDAGQLLTDTTTQSEPAKEIEAKYFEETPLRWAQGQKASYWQPALDIYAEKDKLSLLMELPGVSSKNLEIILERASLCVRGARICGGLAVGSARLHNEIPFGWFERRITLPFADYLIFDMRLDCGILWLQLERLK